MKHKRLIGILFIVALTFFACKNISQNRPLKISTKPLDTIQSKPARVVASPGIFENAFTKGATAIRNNKPIGLYGVTIGKLKVISGRIIACDPMHIDEYGKPFTQLFPTGEFPVQLSIASLQDAETIAFARISFSDQPVDVWKFALLDGQSEIPLGNKKIYGYSVDAGVGAYIDNEVNKALDRTKVTRMGEGIYKEMEGNYRNDWRYTMHNFGRHNMAAFSSGFGDGYYATYIGFDAKGQACRLLTDFGLFDWARQMQP